MQIHAPSEGSAIDHVHQHQGRENARRHRGQHCGEPHEARLGLDEHGGATRSQPERTHDGELA